MQDIAGAYTSSLDRPEGLELYVRDYPVHPGTQAKALVVMVHGTTFHSGPFQPVAEYFNTQGACPFVPTIH
jgi:alpha-beta hydrolase superfamily lysophospholipase